MKLRLARMHICRLGALALAATLSCIAHADSIKLLSSVRVPDDSGRIALRDIAQLDGAAAKALADVVITTIQHADGPVTLTVQQVREHLSDAGVNWSRVDLSGGTVILRPRRSGAVAPPAAMIGITLRDNDNRRTVRQPTTAKRTAATVLDDGTVESEVARLLIAQLGVPATHLQLNIARDQNEVLGRSTDGGRFDVRPLGAAMSDRLELLIREWRGTQIVAQHFVTLHPLLLTELAVAASDVDRNTMLTEAQLDSNEQWLPPSQAMLSLSCAEAVGRFMESRVRAGEVIRSSDVRRATLIKRGSPIMIRCIVSGVAISLQAEAMDDGGLGDVIEVRKVGERDTFMATITGPGEAVVETGT